MKGNSSFAGGIPSHYKILHDTVLGEGSFGVVRLAVNQKSNERFAIKFLPREVTSDAIEKEYLLHKAASSHPNVIKMIAKYEDMDGFYFVMEYAAGGELFDRIEPDIGFGSQDLAHAYFYQLVNALESIHAKGIVHRDLKPENVLLDERGALKLTDFGVSTLFMYRGERRKIQVKCGSELYMAPQVYTNNSPYEGELADIWSLGVMLFVMILGKLPWERPDCSQCEQFSHYQKNGIEYLRWCGRNRLYRIDECVFDLMESMLKINEDERASLSQIKQHAWFLRCNPLIDGENGEVRWKELMEMLLKGPHVYRLENLPIHEDTTSIKEPAFLPFSQPDNFGSGLSQCISTSPSKSGCLPIPWIPTIPNQSAVFSQPLQNNFNVFYSQIQSQDIACPLALEHAALGIIDTNALRLTRFYSPLSNDTIIQQMSLILDSFLIQVKVIASTKIQFKTVDMRKCVLSGEIIVAPFGSDKHVVIFKKNRGDSIEFKRLFHAVYEAFQTSMV